MKTASLFGATIIGLASGVIAACSASTEDPQAPESVAPQEVSSPLAVDPCARVPSQDNGAYCGLTSQFGFNSSAARPTTIYFCVNGRTARTVRCARGCVVAPPGVPDFCQ